VAAAKPGRIRSIGRLSCQPPESGLDIVALKLKLRDESLVDEERAVLENLLEKRTWPMSIKKRSKT
jgi:hypothetical protein